MTNWLRDIAIGVASAEVFGVQVRPMQHPAPPGLPKRDRPDQSILIGLDRSECPLRQRLLAGRGRVQARGYASDIAQMFEPARADTLHTQPLKPAPPQTLCRRDIETRLPVEQPVFHQQTGNDQVVEPVVSR